MTGSTRGYLGNVPTMNVYFEEGRKHTFALAVDWPGWARRGTSCEHALTELANYQIRYEEVIGQALPSKALRVIGTVPGTTTTDFGAPGVQGPWDEKPLPRTERQRQLDIVERCWSFFDQVATTSPRVLTKGPRGGGRDRDDIIDHVREAERAYSAKAGVRVPPRTPWPLQRDLVANRITEGFSDQAWSPRYALRRIAWHVLDHAWEIEDKSNPA